MIGLRSPTLVKAVFETCGYQPAPDDVVEQPAKFEFVINLKTAKQIGVAVPPNVLAGRTE